MPLHPSSLPNNESQNNNNNSRCSSSFTLMPPPPFLSQPHHHQLLLPQFSCSVDSCDVAAAPSSSSSSDTETLSCSSKICQGSSDIDKADDAGDVVSDSPLKTHRFAILPHHDLEARSALTPASPTKIWPSSEKVAQNESNGSSAGGAGEAQPPPPFLALQMVMGRTSGSSGLERLGSGGFSAASGYGGVGSSDNGCRIRAQTPLLDRMGSGGFSVVSGYGGGSGEDAKSRKTPHLETRGSGTFSNVSGCGGGGGSGEDAYRMAQTPCLESVKASSQFKGVVPQPNGRWGAQIYDRNQRVWLGTFNSEEEAARAYDRAALKYRGKDAVTNFKTSAAQEQCNVEEVFLSSHSKERLVDMLRRHVYEEELEQKKKKKMNEEEEKDDAGSSHSKLRRSPPVTHDPSPTENHHHHGMHASVDQIRGNHKIDGLSGVTSSKDQRREHLFDKSLTPSDVGKLNRLVIPKQHAERCFPLDSSVNEKGLMLSLEDSNGKVWRFRYSYWGSSQSYVFTKGWSGFVKEKKLEAGDIVTFERAAGTLYIDCKRCPTAIAMVPLSAPFVASSGLKPMHQQWQLHHLQQHAVPMNHLVSSHFLNKQAHHSTDSALEFNLALPMLPNSIRFQEHEAGGQSKLPQNERHHQISGSNAAARCPSALPLEMLTMGASSMLTKAAIPSGIYRSVGATDRIRNSTNTIATAIPCSDDTDPSLDGCSTVDLLRRRDSASARPKASEQSSVGGGNSAQQPLNKPAPDEQAELSTRLSGSGWTSTISYEEFPSTVQTNNGKEASTSDPDGNVAPSDSVLSSKGFRLLGADPQLGSSPSSQGLRLFGVDVNPQCGKQSLPLQAPHAGKRGGSDETLSQTSSESCSKKSKLS